MQQIIDELERQFPGDHVGVTRYRTHLLRVLSDFSLSGFADAKFSSELTSGNSERFWSCLSEALIFERLRSNLLPRSVVGAGPDFLVSLGGKPAWVEVICPTAAGLPGDWTKPTGSGVRSLPHEAILLRWTSSIKEKTEKLIGCDSTVGYLQKEVVASGDPYVIAINGRQLRSSGFPALHGISQFPFAVEAVFPIGPYQLSIDVKTLETVGGGYQPRFSVAKPSGSLVPTSMFLDPRFAHVSAIWAVDFDGTGCVGNWEPSALVHNPLALNPIPRGCIESDEEFVAERCSRDEYSLVVVRARELNSKQ